MNLSKFKFNLVTFSILLILFNFIYRGFFNTSFYADGSCYFLWDYLGGIGKFHNFNRTLALELHHVFFYFLEFFSIQDFNINLFLWKLGFGFPFLLGFFSCFLLSSNYRNYTLIALLISYLFFYQFNSMFAVGEYHIAFFFAPVVLGSFKEYFETKTNNSLILLIISSIILAFSYELNMLATLFLFIFLICFKSFEFLSQKNIKPSKFTFSRVFYFIVENLPLLIITIILIISIFYIRWVLNLHGQGLLENARRAVHEYLYQPYRGAFSDTYNYFLLFFSSAFFFLYRISSIHSKFRNKFILNLFISIIFLVSILSNHIPVHSYYSKTIYLPLFYLFLLNYFFIPSDSILKFISFYRFFIIFTVTIVIVFSINQGREFNKYLKLLQRNVNSVEVGVLRKVDPDFFARQTVNGMKYDWSWGHECLTTIFNPDRKSLIIKDDTIGYPYRDTVRDLNVDIRSAYRKN